MVILLLGGVKQVSPGRVAVVYLRLGRNFLACVGLARESCVFKDYCEMSILLRSLLRTGVRQAVGPRIDEVRALIGATALYDTERRTQPYKTPRIYSRLERTVSATLFRRV